MIINKNKIKKKLEKITQLKLMHKILKILIIIKKFKISKNLIKIDINLK